MFVEVTGEKLVGSSFCPPPPPAWIGLTLLQAWETARINPMKTQFIVLHLRPRQLNHWIKKHGNG